MASQQSALVTDEYIGYKLTAVAVFFIVSEAVLVSLRYFARYVARTSWATDPGKYTSWAKSAVAVEIIYCTAVVFPKLAILAMYLRLFPIKKPYRGLVSSIVRFTIFYGNEAFVDGTWASVNLMTWTLIEPGVYLIAACLPNLRPLWFHFKKKPLSSSESSQKTVAPTPSSDRPKYIELTA
ncbi:MAG: hypothetical protein Q9219_006462 [cf. Caloplaca sp. 3 TL-2023]